MIVRVPGAITSSKLEQVRSNKIVGIWELGPRCHSSHVHATDAGRSDFIQILFTSCRLGLEAQSSRMNQVASVKLHNSPHRLHFKSYTSHSSLAKPCQVSPGLSRSTLMNKEARWADQHPELQHLQSQCSPRNTSLGFPRISHPSPHSSHATARPDTESATR